MCPGEQRVMLEPHVWSFFFLGEEGGGGWRKIRNVFQKTKPNPPQKNVSVTATYFIFKKKCEFSVFEKIFQILDFTQNSKIFRQKFVFREIK